MAKVPEEYLIWYSARESLAGMVYTTHTGKRVAGYCRYCEAESIHDYKTDHHDDGSKNSYKECRCCGTKVTVTKRLTKQKVAHAAKQEGFRSLVDELLAKSILAAATDILKTGRSSVILQKSL